ncbi:MAG: PorV/PorQ family protein [Elusimicrobiota bacterium]
MKNQQNNGIWKQGNMETRKYGKILVSIFLYFYISCLLASDSGTSAGLLFRISPSAKTAGIAEAVTSISENLAASDVNPASISTLPHYNFSVSHSEYFEDVNIEEIKFSKYLQIMGGLSGNIGLLTKYLSLKDIERDKRGVNQNEFRNSATVIGLLYATKIYPVDFGLTFKYLHEQLSDETAAAIAFDCGFLYSTPLYKLPIDFGFSVRNIGPKTGYGVTKDFLPFETRFGMSHQFSKALVSIDGIWQRENNLLANLGAELTVTKNFCFRCGYTTLNRYSLGAGFLAGMFSVDYSVTTHTELTDIHRFTVSCKF